MNTTLVLQNLKCEGCANTILKKIANCEGVSNPKIDVQKNSLQIDHISHNALMGLYMSLKTIGYPVEGETNSIINKTRSFMSCAIGKMT